MPIRRSEVAPCTCMPAIISDVALAMQNDFVHLLFEMYYLMYFIQWVWQWHGGGPSFLCTPLSLIIANECICTLKKNDCTIIRL